MEANSFKIVIVGHIDHGKSTLIGRLLYDTGRVTPEKYEEIRHVCEEQGKPFEFAYVMDHLKEERDRGITIDTAQTFFKTQKRRYVIIDAPGHKEFLKNMVTGASQAEAAILLIDAKEGLMDQTRRHCYILGLLGLRQIAVLINKMDLIDYSKERFESLKKEICDYLSAIGAAPTYVLPISARSGDNIVKKSERLDWFSGHSVLSALDTFKAIEADSSGLRFPVQDVYGFTGPDEVYVGRVESGSLRKGQTLRAMPSGKAVKVRAIRKLGQDSIEASHMGECAGLVLEGGYKPERGDILVDESAPEVTNRLKAHIFWMPDSPGRVGERYTFKCVTQETPCTLARIIKRFDPASLEVVTEDDTVIKAAEVAEVELLLDAMVAVDPFIEIAETGRFVLEKDDHPVAGGTVI